MIQTSSAAAMLAAATFLATPASAGSIHLNDYRLSASYRLDFTEASGVAYNASRNTLFVVGNNDGGEFTTTGQRTRRIDLDGFGDLEGVTWLGGDTFAVSDERNQEIVRISVESTGFENGLQKLTYRHKSQSPRYAIDNGANVGNLGLEGISYDPMTGRYYGVKQDSPKRVSLSYVNFGGGGSFTNTAFSSSFAPRPLSDIAALSTVSSFRNLSHGSNLLVLLRDNATLYELTRSGSVLSTLNLGGFGVGALEGVAVDNSGTIYVVGEDGPSGGSGLLVLRPGRAPTGAIVADQVFFDDPDQVPAVPAPAALALFGLGAAALLRRR